MEDIEEKIIFYCNRIVQNPILSIAQAIDPEYPSIRFALETALFDLQSGGKQDLFETEFAKGKKSIPINGLVWMGDKQFMQDQLIQKIEEGYNCIKIKVGAIDFKLECELLNSIRENFSSSEMIIRVDANGAFSFKEAQKKLNELSRFDLHSIEQPIKQGQIEFMKVLCAESPIPIALDEELIGVFTEQQKKALLETILPQYIILKPALLGGMMISHDWINIAENLGIAWWITSALESNIGLNAIAQFTSFLDPNLHQGLGTGQLYHNNIESPLEIKNGHLFYNTTKNWNINGELESIA